MSVKTIDYGERGTVVVYPDAVGLARAAADLVRNLSIGATQDRGYATIALSGGSTPAAMGALLADDPYRDEVPWASTHIFWGDERVVPLESPESNAGEAKRGFLDVVPIPAGNVRTFPVDEDPESAATGYEDIIRAVVPGEPVPMFDLILLGMGFDGHTASLFPGTEALGVRDRLVVANKVPQLETTRLTFTAPLINAARAIAFLVAGSSKSQRLAEVLESDPDPHRLPAQLIQPKHGVLTWLVDTEAASHLDRFR